MQIFPRELNYLPLALAVVAGALGAGVFLLFWVYFTPSNTQVGYTPKQPVPYSHRLHAGELGMDVARFEGDFRDLSNKKVVDNDTSEARAMGLTGTPAFFVNGRYLRGAQPFAGFKKIIDEELGRLNLPIPEANPS